MDKLYYYYYLFYTRVVPENSPRATTIFALSASEGSFVNGLINVFAINKYCVFLDKWIMIMILLIIMALNYMYFYKSGRYKRIELQQPMFFNNHKISILVSVCFFLFTVSWIFWVPIYGKQILENCR